MTSRERVLAALRHESPDRVPRLLYEEAIGYTPPVERLSFWGTVSVQRTMAFGTPDEVRAEVHQRIRDVGCGGGLILAPAHVLGPEVPWENILAFFQAAEHYPPRTL
jgi:uroporphyrinogen-III decarboxylase